MYEISMNGKKFLLKIMSKSPYVRIQIGCKNYTFSFFFVEMDVKNTICRKFEISKNQHVFAAFSQCFKNLIFEKKSHQKVQKTKSLFTIDNVILNFFHEKKLILHKKSFLSIDNRIHIFPRQKHFLY